ncbi:MAG: pyruvate kinase, partial [Chitinophagia bacterium]|nr:pyruvate kinase [Chitinophagia bacterium]
MAKHIDKYLHREYDNEAGRLHAYKRTKIVATVGPACDTYDKLLDLVKAGVNVFRLNFSHGSHEDKAKIIEFIQQINKTQPYNIAILADLQGPKLRVGELEGGSIELVAGEEFLFTNEKITGTKSRIFVSYDNLHQDVKKGEKILLDDGKLEVVVQEITPSNDVRVKVLLGGTLLPKKGVNLPETNISLPALTPKDLADLDFIFQHPIDWIALSFVRSPNCINNLKERIQKSKHSAKVISKIEMPQAIKHLREIIRESDGIMIARGDLGVELPIEEVPLIQKDIIKKCI